MTIDTLLELKQTLTQQAREALETFHKAVGALELIDYQIQQMQDKADDNELESQRIEQ